MSVTNGALPRDIYGSPANAGYVPGVGVTADQNGPSTLDNQNQASAPKVVSFSPTTAIGTPADSLPFAGQLPAVDMVQTGTGVMSPLRVGTQFIQLKAQAVTAGTPVSVFTPTSGKKFRILSYHLSLSVAGSILFEDTTGVEVLRTPLLPSATGQAAPSMGNGYLSSAANNQLFLDVSASGSVSGWINIMQE